MITKKVVVESARGCGYRSPGAGGVGIYLRGELAAEPCERLPFPLYQCPCCGGGIKPSRGFTWIDPEGLFHLDQEPECDPTFPDHSHGNCPLCNPHLGAGEDGRAGLIWIGVKHYPDPLLFMVEARVMGVSRKLSAVPRGFEVGKHWIYLAHKRAIATIVDTSEGKLDVEFEPGVFFVWKPTRVELVVDDLDDIPEKALNIAKTIGEENVEIVKVVRDIDAQGKLFDLENDDD